MTERDEMIYAAGEELLSERLLENIDTIIEAFQREAEIYCTEFSARIDRLMRITAKAQRAEGKGRIAFLCFSFLQSSLYTQSYEMQIDAYDESFYKDTRGACVYWDAGFIFQYFRQDMEYFRTHIGTGIPRIREYEMMAFSQRYAMHYCRIAQEFIKARMEELLPEIRGGVLAAEKLAVTFGGLYDYSVLLLEKDMR